MTHCDGFRAAAVARESEVAGIGIDAEPHLPLPGAVAGIIAVGDERPMLTYLEATRPQIAWRRVLFSAKESVYKTLHFLTDSCPRFNDYEVIVNPDAGTFAVRTCTDLPFALRASLDRLEGRWRVLLPEAAPSVALIATTAVVMADTAP